MVAERLFYDWVNKKLDVYFIILFTLCLGMSSGVPTSISPYVVSGLSSNPANGPAYMYAYFAGMSLGIIVAQYLQLRYSSKTLLIAICLSLILFNFILTNTDSTTLIFLLSFIVGVIRMMGSIVLLLAFMPILMPRGERHKLYALYYPIALMVSPISGLGLAFFSDKFSWHLSFHFCNLLLFICCFLAIILVRPGSQKKPVALWDVDWFSCILAGTWMLSFVYFLTYGRSMDWFDSKEIRIAAIISLVSFVALFVKTCFQHNPIFDLSILKLRNIRVGLVYIFLFGVFFSITTILSPLMTISFHNDPVYNATINLMPIIGYILGAIIAFLYFTRFSEFKPMLVASAIMYLASCVILYFNIDRNISTSTLSIILICRGFGIVFSYMTIGLYMTIGVPGKHLSAVPVMLIFVRTYVGTVIFSNLYSVYMYKLQVRMLDKLASWSESDISNFIFYEHFGKGHKLPSLAAAYKQYSLEASLASMKILIGYVIIFGIAFTIFLLIFPIYKKDDKTILNWQKTKNINSLAVAVTA